MIFLALLLAVVTAPYAPPTYVCNGSTAVFTVNFPYLANTDVVLTSTTAGGVSTTLAQGTDYTLNVSSSTSTALATLTAPASTCPTGNQLKIFRRTDKTQPYSFRMQTSFDPALFELAYDRQLMITQETALGTVANGDISQATVLIPGTTTAVNISSLLAGSPIPAKAFGVTCDGSDEHLRVQQCATSAVQCALPPVPTCDSGTTTITLPPGHSFASLGMRTAHLRHHGTGCGVSVDNNDGWGLYRLSLDSIGTTTGTMGLCVTNVNGATLRGTLEDVMITSDAPSGSPVSGTYGVYIHSTSGNSNYYADFRHLVTLGWDRGVESLGDTGSGGANANFFSAYSGNANRVGIFFDNFSGDNWVQGHCNGSGQVGLAQNCVTIGDGVHNSGGNFLVGVTNDTGALGTAFKLFTPSGSNVVVAVNEGGATDTFTSDSTNFVFANKNVGVASQHTFLPDLNLGNGLGGTTGLFNSTFIVARLVATTTAGGGTVALTAGSAAVTVASGARCVCSDTTAVNACKVSVASTTATFTGTSTDTLAYFCY